MKWLDNLIKKYRDLTSNDGVNWTCETKGQWVTIRDHGEMIYNGLKSDMPPNIKRVYEKRIEEIDKLWNDKLFKDNMSNGKRRRRYSFRKSV